MGGITEALKVAAIASAWHIDVIPHAGGLQPWALHFIAARVNCPLAECVVIGNPGDEEPLRSMFPYLDGVPLPEDGFIRPFDEPGVGVTLNPEWFGE
jgi:L-rhamnonate dehydratase